MSMSSTALRALPVAAPARKFAVAGTTAIRWYSRLRAMWFRAMGSSTNTSLTIASSDAGDVIAAADGESTTPILSAPADRMAMMYSPIESICSAPVQPRSTRSTAALFLAFAPAWAVAASSAATSSSLSAMFSLSLFRAGRAASHRAVRLHPASAPIASRKERTRGPTPASRSGRPGSMNRGPRQLRTRLRATPRYRLSCKSRLFASLRDCPASSGGI